MSTEKWILAEDEGGCYIVNPEGSTVWDAAHDNIVSFDSKAEAEEWAREQGLAAYPVTLKHAMEDSSW